MSETGTAVRTPTLGVPAENVTAGSGPRRVLLDGISGDHRPFRISSELETRALLVEYQGEVWRIKPTDVWVGFFSALTGAGGTR